MSAPFAAELMAAPIVVATAAFVVSSAVLAASAPGVPEAARVAASAAWMAASEVCFAFWRAAAVAAGTPRHAGMPPIRTFALPGPGPNTGGRGWATGSLNRAACGIGDLLYGLESETGGALEKPLLESSAASGSSGSRYSISVDAVLWPPELM